MAAGGSAWQRVAAVGSGWQYFISNAVLNNACMHACQFSGVIFPDTPLPPAWTAHYEETLDKMYYHNR